MPANLRAHPPRKASSSRPYDRRRLSTISPTRRHPSPPSAEPIEDPERPPDHPGLPTYDEYKRVEAGYLLGLSPRKRDKALITQAMFDKIWDVLHQPDACTVETPQFRFWVRKMFTLSRPMGSPRASDGGAQQWAWHWDGAPGTHPHDASSGPRGNHEEADLALERAMGIGRDTADAMFLTSPVVLHENRPVAIVEQLYELFCFCHVRAGHGGRDKTCAVIREYYSWVPKELTAQFVKACPTCALKRTGGGELGAAILQKQVTMPGLGSGQGECQRGSVLGTRHEAPPSLRWPLTGGPLDPVNPLPCGVREREQLRGCEDLRLPPVWFPGLTEARLPRGGWNVPGTLAGPPSPFRACDPVACTGMTTSFPQPFSADTKFTKTSTHQDVTHSPTKTCGLPSLTSALSDESLDEDVKLSRLAHDDACVCLPPTLRPLRLSAPVSPDEHGTLEDANTFPIDPDLLSFGHLNGASPGVSSGAGTPEGRGQRAKHVMSASPASSLCARRMRGGSDADQMVPTNTTCGVVSPIKPFAELVNASRYSRGYPMMDSSCYRYGPEQPDAGPLTWPSATESDDLVRGPLLRRSIRQNDS